MFRRFIVWLLLCITALGAYTLSANRIALRMAHRGVPSFTYIDSLNGYDFYHGVPENQCEMIIHFTYEGYEFYNNDGCTQTFEALDIFVAKQGRVYVTQELLEQGEITIQDYYQQIYLKTRS